MVENLESLDDLEEEDGGRGMAMAAIVGSAVAAGLVAYLLRRSRQEPEPPDLPQTSARAWDRARGLAFNEERAHATRDFMVEKILPELKPALLGILEEIEELVDDGFRRAERAIKSL